MNTIDFQLGDFTNQETNNWGFIPHVAAI